MRWTTRGFALACALTLLGAAARAAEYVDVWGPPVGASVPLLAANDHTGRARNLDNLAGERGLLLIFNRSVDW